MKLSDHIFIFEDFRYFFNILVWTIHDSLDHNISILLHKYYDCYKEIYNKFEVKKYLQFMPKIYVNSRSWAKPTSLSENISYFLSSNIFLVLFIHTYMVTVFVWLYIMYKRVKAIFIWNSLSNYVIWSLHVTLSNILSNYCRFD